MGDLFGTGGRRASPLAAEAARAVDGLLAWPEHRDAADAVVITDELTCAGLREPAALPFRHPALARLAHAAIDTLDIGRAAQRPSGQRTSTIRVAHEARRTRDHLAVLASKREASRRRPLTDMSGRTVLGPAARGPGRGLAERHAIIDDARVARCTDSARETGLVRPWQADIIKAQIAARAGPSVAGPADRDAGPPVTGRTLEALGRGPAIASDRDPAEQRRRVTCEPVCAPNLGLTGLPR